MQTQLADFIRGTPEGQEAEAILRKCVHCGFCTAPVRAIKCSATTSTARAGGST
jgi:heterodisulfide reductase subunit C